MEEKELTVAETLSAASLDSETSIEKLTAEIQYYLVQMGQNAIEIGKRLTLAKAKLQHGEWQSWLEDNFNLSPNMAGKFMQMARRFGNSATSQNLKQSQMMEMLSLPEVETEKFIEQKAAEGTPVEDMTVKKLREEIKKYKFDLTAVPPEKSSAVEISDNVSKIQTPEILNESQETEDAVKSEKVEVADVALEISNEVEEKVEEMPLENLEESMQEENFVGVEIPDKETEKTNLAESGLELLTKFFNYLPLILGNADLQKLVENYAVKDLQGLEKQLGQLSTVHKEIADCLEDWKKQQGAEMERQAVLSTLKQIALADKPPFKKSKYVRDSVNALGFESVHKVPTKELQRILNEVSQLKN